MAFASSDDNGDDVLSFDEFRKAVARLRGHGKAPPEVPTDEEREIFQQMDRDGDGVISSEEWFLWTLDLAARDSMGHGWHTLFESFDYGGEGCLTAIEFTLAIESMGFQTCFAQDLFCEMDTDHSGSITYDEFHRQLSQIKLTGSAQRFVANFTFRGAHVRAHAERMGKDPRRLSASSSVAVLAGQTIDFGTWDVTADDEPGLRASLLHHLASSKLEPSTLFELLATASEVTSEADAVAGAGPNARPAAGPPVPPRSHLTEDIFINGLQRLGYRGDRALLSRIFADGIEKAKPDVASAHELQEWLNGVTGRRRIGRELHLLHGLPETARLEDLEWTVNGLRNALVAMLQRHELAPLDLLRLWDKNRDADLSSHEFLVMIKALVRLPADAPLPAPVTAPVPAPVTAPVPAPVTAPTAAPAAETAVGSPEEMWGDVGRCGETAVRSPGEDPWAIRQSDVSPNISQHLPVSPHISPHLPSPWTIHRSDALSIEGEITNLANGFWYATIRPVVVDAFDQLAGPDHRASIKNVVRWLTKVWIEQRHASALVPALAMTPPTAARAPSRAPGQLAGGPGRAPSRAPGQLAREPGRRAVPPRSADHGVEAVEDEAVGSVDREYELELVAMVLMESGVNGQPELACNGSDGAGADAGRHVGHQPEHARDGVGADAGRRDGHPPSSPQMAPRERRRDGRSMRPPAEPISIEGLYERFGRPSFVPEGTALVMLDAKGVVIDAPFRHRRRLHVPAVTAARATGVLGTGPASREAASRTLPAAGTVLPTRAPTRGAALVTGTSLARPSSRPGSGMALGRAYATAPRGRAARGAAGVLTGHPSAPEPYGPAQSPPQSPPRVNSREQSPRARCSSMEQRPLLDGRGEQGDSAWIFEYSDPAWLREYVYN
jgi:Ca2+-binding EF-hand superfamily protein